MPETSQRPWWILAAIVIGQFAGTSQWFAGNAILPDLITEMSLPDHAVSTVTSAVQFGFIIGTLLFAILNVADRFSPRLIFLICALTASVLNLLILMKPLSFELLLSSRFSVGLFLAGIYPVGMKIAASWYKEGLGKALGYLVGALVLGTAFPHLIGAIGADIHWTTIVIGVSTTSAAGGIILYLLVKDGPYLKKGSKFDPMAIVKLFSNRPFRSAAIGYFGHMWELYTFWAFVPAMITLHLDITKVSSLNVSLWSFLVISIGFISCIAGGYIAVQKSSERVGAMSLAISGVCCLVAPIMYSQNSAVFLLFMLIWGGAVISDSPQFSSLVARYADPAYVGSGLTIVNSLGFAVTIISLAAFDTLRLKYPELASLLLFVGPVLGLLALRPLLKKNKDTWPGKKPSLP